MGNKSSSVRRKPEERKKELEEKKQRNPNKHPRDATIINDGNEGGVNNSGDKSQEVAKESATVEQSLLEADHCAGQADDSEDDSSEVKNVGLNRPSDSETEPLHVQDERKLPQTVEKDLELKLALHSQATKELNVYSLQRVPSHVLALKKYVQSTYNVPQYCQSVEFDGVSLLDSDTLPFHYMRSGDVIDIHFQSEADIEFISGILDSLSRVITYLDYMEPELCQATAVQTHISIQQMQDIQDMSVVYFHCTLEERSHANLFFFCANGGHNMVNRLHKHILSHPWRCLPDELKFLENISLLLCWDISELSAKFNSLAFCYPIQSTLVQIASGNRAKHCSLCISSSPNTVYSPIEDQQLFKDTTMRASSALTK